MKLLTVYYSRTGYTKKLAESISRMLESEIMEITEQRSRKGPIGYLHSAKQAVGKELSDIEIQEKDFSDYDLVLVGTPVWVGTMAPPIRTYITRMKDFQGNVAFFCTSGRGKYENVLREMGELSGKEPVAIFEMRARGIKQGDMDSKLVDFVETIKKL